MVFDFQGKFPFQNPPVIPCDDRCLDPLKAEPQEVFVGPNADPHKVFGRLWLIEVYFGPFKCVQIFLLSDCFQLEGGLYLYLTSCDNDHMTVDLRFMIM